MRYAVITILQCVCLFSQAQNNPYHFTRYTASDGLSNSSINCIIKDSRNFTWIGTEEGLNRFDGNRFVSYFSDHNDPATLSGNIIFDLLQYRPGHLLIATNNGLSVFNTFTNGFENDKITIPALQKGSGNYVRSLFKDKQQRLYVNHSGVIDVFNDSLVFLYRFTDLPWARSLNNVLVNKESWIQDSQGRIWIPTDNKGLCIIDENKQQVYSGLNNPMNYPFMVEHAPIRGFLFDEQQQVLWYSVWGQGLEKYNLKTREHQQQLFNLPIANESRCINSIAKERNDRLICGGGQAIYSVDPETLQYTVISENFDVNSLPAFLGSTIMIDTAHIWIGTETKGLMKLPAGGSYIKQLSLPYAVHNYTNSCSGIVRSVNDKIYMAYRQDGLLEIDPVTHAIRRYTYYDDEGKTESIIRICEDKQGRLWIGNTNGFFLFDKLTKKISRPAWLPSFTNNLTISFMYCDKAGNMWISFRLPNALGFYHASENKFHYYEKYRINDQTAFDSMSIVSRITEDERGNIWMISYLNGKIVCYEPATGQWKSFPGKQKKSISVLDKGLNSISPAGVNEFWLSNDLGSGLAKYNCSTDSISFITRKNGLLSDNILSISKGSNNNLFLVSKAGINFFNPVTNEIRSLQLNDENINLSFAYQQFYDSTNHQLIYGLNDRILFIKDGIWKSVAGNQVTWIDNIVVNNTPVYIDPLTQKLVLRYFEKNITISFASIDYAENSFLSYAYKMEGADNDWIISSQVSSANYTNLSPGRYTFMVKAKNQTGGWGPVSASLQVIIAPPFWQTWWFISATLILIGCAVYWLFRKRIKAVRNEAVLKQRIAETEMMALRAQMNPHFIFNCINSIDALIQSNDKYQATIYLNKFAKLIRNILDSSKQNVVTLSKDMETLQLYVDLEQFRNENKFTVDIKAESSLLQDDFKVPPLIIQPYVENAILHGLKNRPDNDGKLSVSVTRQNGQLEFIIEDNGVGLRSSGNGHVTGWPVKQNDKQSYGMQMSRDRVKIFNKEETASVIITDLEKDGLAAGTKVKVLLNIQ